MRKLWVGFTQFTAVVVVGGLVVGACLAALIPGLRDLAGANTSRGEVTESLSILSQRTTVYADDGVTRIGLLGLEDRQYAALDEVPQILIDAVLVTEDRSFWENPGFDLRSVLRALGENVTTGEITQGGSTITQQLAKNRLLTPDRDLNRKARELLLAYRLNAELTKEQILEEYLNTVYFGQGAYGVRSAVERFFTFVDPVTGAERPKWLNELNAAEAALLAGSISDPNRLNPFEYPGEALQRRQEVLNLMAEEGVLTPEEVALSVWEPLPTKLPPAELRPDNYFVEEVQRRLLEDERLGETREEREHAVLRGGLRVESTMNVIAQFNAQAAVDSVMPDGGPFTGAIVAMEPRTGAVKAVVGGEGFQQSQYNLATQPPGRQPGSTYKAITLAAALEEGYSPNDLVDGRSPCLIDGYGEGGLGKGRAVNAEGGGGGVMSLRAATTGSVNCAYLHLVEELGVDRVAGMANRMGIENIEGVRTVPTTPNFTSITLGTINATPLEMAAVGSVLAAGGVRHEPNFYSKVWDGDDNLVIDNTDSEGERVLAADVASCELDILRGTITGGTGTAARLDRDVAGKTGTTDNRADAWFLGMTPGLVSVVWRGAPNEQLPGAGFGGDYPARTWRAFMVAQLADEPELEFGPPGSVCDRPGGSVGDVRAPSPRRPEPILPPSTAPESTSPQAVAPAGTPASSLPAATVPNAAELP